MRPAAFVALLAVLGIRVPPDLGYAAVGVLIAVESMGVPVPGETALIAAAVLAGRGKLDIGVVIAVAAAGAIIGDNIGYAIGRRGGRKLLESRRGPFYERRRRLVAYGDSFFERHGAKAVFLGRWMSLLRITAAWMAGANRMPARRFFLYNALGGISWAASVALVAYWLGEAAGKVLEKAGVAGAALFGLVVVAGFVYVRRRERRALH